MSNEYYVYAYIDPRDGSVFYIGKGKGDRAYAHLKESRLKNTNQYKFNKIRSIYNAGMVPVVDIVMSCLTDEEACCHEAKLIKSTANLTNIMPGGVPTTKGLTKEQRAFFHESIIKFRDRKRRARLIEKGCHCDPISRGRSKYTAEELAHKAALRASSRGSVLTEDQLFALGTNRPLRRKPTKRENDELFRL